MFIDESELLINYPYRVTIKKNYKDQEDLVQFLTQTFGVYGFWRSCSNKRMFDSSCLWIMNYATISCVDYHFKNETDALFFCFST